MERVEPALSRCTFGLLCVASGIASSIAAMVYALLG